MPTVAPSPSTSSCGSVNGAPRSRPRAGQRIRNSPIEPIPTMLLSTGAHIIGPNVPRAFSTWPSITVNP